MKNFLCTLYLLLFLSEAVWSAPRQVAIAWEEKPQASSYDIQVSNSPELDTLVVEKKIKKAEIKLNLEPGVYYYRLRWTSRENKVGPWSDVEGFVVNAGPPDLLAPADGASFNQKLPPTGIIFKWTKGIQSTKGKIEIKDEHGVVLSRGVEQDSLNWSPEAAGKYSWRVGFEALSAIEWSTPREFSVSPKALRSKVKVRIVKQMVAQEAQWRFLKFQFSLLFQKNGRDWIYSQSFDWTPALILSESFYVGGILGLYPSSFVSDLGETKSYYIGEYGLVVGMTPKMIRPISIEIGPGAETFFFDGFRETYPKAILNLSWNFNSKLFRVIDRLVLGYNISFVSNSIYEQLSNKNIQVVRLGLGIRF